MKSSVIFPSKISYISCNFISKCLYLFIKFLATSALKYSISKIIENIQLLYILLSIFFIKYCSKCSYVILSLNKLYIGIKLYKYF